MKNQKWLTICIALALAAVMLWAVPSLAQMRGRGGPGQGWGCWQGQGQGQARGPGNGAYCPYYSGYSGNQSYRGRGYWGNNPQANTGNRGPMRGGSNYQADTQPTPPPATK